MTKAVYKAFSQSQEKLDMVYSLEAYNLFEGKKTQKYTSQWQYKTMK